MTKQEHLELQKWLSDILDMLKTAKMCPISAEARELIIKAAKNLQFLGENLDGGVLNLDDGSKISTGEFLQSMATVLVRDVEATYLQRTIDAVENLVNNHAAFVARIPDPN